MTWSTKTGKREVLENEQKSVINFLLAGKLLSMAPEVTYLGISLAPSELTGSNTIKRIRIAKAAVHHALELFAFLNSK